MTKQKVIVRVAGRNDTSSGKLTRFITSYENFVKEKKKESLEALNEIGMTIMKNTKPHVPVDTGALKNSGRYNIVETKKGFRLDVKFGGKDFKVTPTKNAPEGFVDYAVIVHEAVDKKFRVGGPKFLTKGIRLSKDEIIKILKQKMGIDL